MKYNAYVCEKCLLILTCGAMQTKNECIKFPIYIFAGYIPCCCCCRYGVEVMY